VEDFLLNAEIAIFYLQLIAVICQFPLSVPLSALVSTHVFAAT
jgi:hypothetical protein